MISPSFQSVLRYSVSFAMFILFSNNCRAATGCGPSATMYPEKIYYSIGVPSVIAGRDNYSNVFFSLDDNSSPAACPKHKYNGVGYSYSTTTRCCINGDCNANYRVWFFTPINCPLDDYIPLLLIASGGFGFVILRKEIFLRYSSILKKLIMPSIERGHN